MRRTLIRLLVAVAVLAVAALVVAQLVVPGIVEDRIEERLTEDGGTAEASVESLPAIGLLLGGGGDRLEIRGEGISVDPLATPNQTLERLDRFDEVDVRLAELAAGPVDAESLTLTRDASGDPYRLQIEASVVPRELARFAGSQFGPLGGLIGGLAGGAVPFAGEALPVDIDAEVESGDQRVQVVSGGGSVAGIPLGPLAGLVIGAIAARI